MPRSLSLPNPRHHEAPQLTNRHSSSLERSTINGTTEEGSGADCYECYSGGWTGACGRFCPEHSYRLTCLPSLASIA
jgi:hypothetical protein